MATEYRDVLVQCPFYKSAKDKVIRCEGVCDSNTIALSFHTKELQLDYMAVYCNKNYKMCRIYRVYVVEDDE